MLIKSMNYCIFFLSLLIYLCSAGCSKKTAIDYLNEEMDRYHTDYYVYTDANSPGNHFVARGRISSKGDDDLVPPMNEYNKANCFSGDTCIKAELISNGNNWGGWCFMNGILKNEDKEPSLNWGTYPNAGVNLSHANELKFLARGEKGGEHVKFFAFGLGRDPDYGYKINDYPDSAAKVEISVILTDHWREYSIDLTGHDLSYVIGGFGWAAESHKASNEPIIFYIDEIKYNYLRLNEPRFITSYETTLAGMKVDTVMRNVAFTYDNAVSLIAYLSAGDYKRAKLIADALVFAQSEDRTFADGRVRNAYKASEIELFSGWEPNGKEISVGMPGYACKKDDNSGNYGWCEDEFQVSTHTGNVAWTMLALLSYYEMRGGEKYLNTVKQLGKWVIKNCKNNKSPKGYTGGYEGWERSSRNKEGQKKLTYKSTEHNIDLYSAFSRLYEITHDEKWNNSAEIAKKFVIAMWDDEQGKFWTGTKEDGMSINKDVIPVDIQAWSILALGDDWEPYKRALSYAESNHFLLGGFDFNEKPDGIWYEGTAQMAVAYHVTGQEEKWKKTLRVIEEIQLKSGAILATNANQLTTGFYLSDGSEWLYYRRPHLGATAWYILARNGTNPFAVMSKSY